VSVEVFAADEQDAQEVDLDRYVRLARAALEAEGVRSPAEVSLLFVDVDAIANLNERFLGKSGPTDVLSFPLEDDPAPSGRSPDSGGGGPLGAEPLDEPELLLGDIVICPEIAVANAARHEVSPADEMALLVVHGALHLLGWDHMIEAEAERMEARERELLGRFDRPAAS